MNEFGWKISPDTWGLAFPAGLASTKGLFQLASLESRYYVWALHSNTFGQWRHQRTLLLPIVSGRINLCFLQCFPPPAAGPVRSRELCKGTKGLSIEQGSNCGFLLSKRLLISDAEPCKTPFRKRRKSDIVLLKQRRGRRGRRESQTPLLKWTCADVFKAPHGRDVGSQLPAGLIGDLALNLLPWICCCSAASLGGGSKYLQQVAGPVSHAPHLVPPVLGVFANPGVLGRQWDGVWYWRTPAVAVIQVDLWCVLAQRGWLQDTCVLFAELWARVSTDSLSQEAAEDQQRSLEWVMLWCQEHVCSFFQWWWATHGFASAKQTEVALSSLRVAVLPADPVSTLEAWHTVPFRIGL